jgi:ADP-heptose:LPS heptosyltransferase
VAVDLHGNGPASRELLAALAPGRLVGFGLAPQNPAWDPDEHERSRWCRLVTAAFGGTADPDDVRLPPPELRVDGSPLRGRSPRTGAVLVHPGAASGARRWPAERFAAVARRLAAAGRQVLLTGSPGERVLAEDVRCHAGLPDDALLAGATGLGTLAGLVASASLVVCGDTGMAHLASAFGTPSVVLFGPTPPARWGPPPGPHVVLWHGADVGDPHAERPDPALLRISVDEVWAACTELLAEPRLPLRA